MKSLIEPRRLRVLALISVLGSGAPAHAEPATDIGLAIASQGNLALQEIRAHGGRDARDQLADRLRTDVRITDTGRKGEPATAGLIAGSISSLRDRSAQAMLAR